MDSNSNYSQFIEHSFRRLSFLIHQQDVPNPSTSTNKTTEQSSSIASSGSNIQNNIDNNESVSFSSKIQSHHQLIKDKLTNSIQSKVKVEPMSRAYRTYMRPPKNRTTISHCCSSSSQVSDQLETSLNHSFNSPCSPSVTQEESNELFIKMPSERTLYDVRFERDRQNDVREKYNIPPPFQRNWLRQPRYVPQERPNFGQTHQSQNQ